LRRPDLISDETALTLQDILPAGAWKSILLQILEVAEEGGLQAGESAGVDSFLVEDRLDEEARPKLRAIAIDDSPFDEGRDVSRVLDDLVGWFERRRLDARQRDLNRRMRDPNADQEALLAEKQAQLIERRARMGLNNAPGKT
jgi:hypothetical protein